MKKLAFLALAALLCAAQAQAFSTEQEQTAGISVLDGRVTLELAAGGDDFYCIGIRFSDNSLNRGCGTYIEIKQRDGSFLLYPEGKRYATIDDAIKDFLEDLVRRHYDNKKQGKKVWAAFVKEGGLQQFIDFAGKVIDDEFLNTPFNDIYG